MKDMITEEDKNLLKEIQNERRLTKKSIESYVNAIRIYAALNKKTMVKLLEEADLEEENGIRWKNRQIRKKLIEYRTYLLENFKLGTVKTYFSKILTIYRHFEIEIHQLPSISLKKANINPDITYDELLTKEEIKNVIKISNPLIKSITLFMISSGSARAETLSLTIQDFINSVEDYTIKKDIYGVLTDLNNKNNIIPTFKLKRQKTNKYYYTFCSPEATEAIINYLISREEELTPEKPLFDIHKEYLRYIYYELNDKLNMGYAGGHTRLRTHAFRKFHASNLNRGKMHLH